MTDLGRIDPEIVRQLNQLVDDVYPPMQAIADQIRAFMSDVEAMMKDIGRVLLPVIRSAFDRFNMATRAARRAKYRRTPRELTYLEAAASKDNRQRRRYGLKRYRSRRRGEAWVAQFIP